MVPINYQDWLQCFETLSTGRVTYEYIMGFRAGRCPGIETVENKFQTHVVETVNNMFSRITRQCTKQVNGILEERDFSETEILFKRISKEMEKCRFYMEIPFLSNEFVKQLDKQFQSEKKRYWNELYCFLMEAADETEQSDMYDMLFYLKRINSKER